MNYSITIQRGSYFAHDTNITPIANDEWLEVIKNNSLFTFDIGLERSDYNYAELFNEDDDSWLHYAENGTLIADNPSPLFIYHMLCLASEFKANVVGEESDVYELNELGFISRVSYADGDRICQWVKVQSSTGIDFKTDS